MWFQFLWCLPIALKPKFSLVTYKAFSWSCQSPLAQHALVTQISFLFFKHLLLRVGALAVPSFGEIICPGWHMAGLYLWFKCQFEISVSQVGLFWLPSIKLFFFSSYSQLYQSWFVTLSLFTWLISVFHNVFHDCALHESTDFVTFYLYLQHIGSCIMLRYSVYEWICTY